MIKFYFCYQISQLYAIVVMFVALLLADFHHPHIPIHTSQTFPQAFSHHPEIPWPTSFHRFGIPTKIQAGTPNIQHHSPKKMEIQNSRTARQPQIEERAAADWHLAKKLPAWTMAILEWIRAAQLPRATPDAVNPMQCIIGRQGVNKAFPILKFLNLNCEGGCSSLVNYSYGFCCKLMWPGVVRLQTTMPGLAYDFK